MNILRVGLRLVALVVFALVLAAGLFGCGQGSRSAPLTEALGQRAPAQAGRVIGSVEGFGAQEGGVGLLSAPARTGLATMLPERGGDTLLADPGWSSTGAMIDAREHHTVTLLPDGQVLVTGGRGVSLLSSAELYDPKVSTWSKTLGDMAAARRGHAAVLLPNGKVLLAGGSKDSFDDSAALSSAELYDPATRSFSPTGNLLTARYNPTATLLLSGKVLVAGGVDLTSNPTATAELYDPATGSFSKTGDLSTPRVTHTATLLPSGNVLVVGGSSSLAAALPSAELYDPQAGSFNQAGPMTTSRAFHTATLLPHGEVLVVCGQDVNYQYLSTAELYDPGTNTWSLTGPLMSSRIFHTATLLPTGDVLVAGGDYTPVAELFDPVSKTWSQTSNAITPLFSQTATLLKDGKVLLAGGHNEFFLIVPSTEIYEAVFSIWQPTTTKMHTARGRHTATPLLNGTVLVAGGEGAQYLSSAELYDPLTGAWIVTGSMAKPREFHSATRLPNGTVLVAGGYGGPNGGLLSTAELYDPATGTWSPTNSMISGRAFAQATLSNGKILVAGGKDAVKALSTAELYDPTTGTWSATSNLSTARLSYTATLLPNGDVLSVGGENTQVAFSTAEIYHPNTAMWSVQSDMSSARTLHTAALLDPDPEGAQRVLVAGGELTSALASAEVYDVTTGKWLPVSPMRTPRREHTATKLADGSVLVAGGYDDTDDALASAERYVRTPNGSRCFFNDDCLSEICTDGVCCNTACAHDGCHACSFVAGAVMDGVCSTFADGFLCNDNDACTAVDACQAGSCVGAPKKVCPGPADDCHLPGVCNPGTGQCEEVLVSDGTTCASKCALAAVCQAGACATVVPVDCPANDDCHLPGSCDAATGTCNAKAKDDGVPCDDGDPCTESDHCMTGKCTSGASTVCPDHLRCAPELAGCPSACVFVTDCLPDFVCDPAGRCVPSPDKQDVLDAGCVLAAPPAAGEGEAPTAVLSLLLTAALIPLRRRRRAPLTDRNERLPSAPG